MKNLIRIFNIAAILFLTFSFQGIAVSSQTSKTLIFAVPPTGDVQELEQTWKPLVEHIARESRLAIKFETAKTMKQFEKHLKKGAYDFIFVDAYMYTRYQKKSGYLAFAKQKDSKDKGVIVVRKDSKINSLEDLRSKKLALPNSSSFESTLLTKMELEKNGINIKPAYLNSSDSVYKAVVKGNIPAGSGSANSLNSINPNAHSKLKVIWSSNQYSSHAFAAHKRVNPEDISRVTSTLAELHNSLEGKRLMNEARLKPVVSAQDDEWNDVRALGLNVIR